MKTITLKSHYNGRRLNLHIPGDTFDKLINGKYPCYTDDYDPMSAINYDADNLAAGYAPKILAKGQHARVRRANAGTDYFSVVIFTDFGGNAAYKEGKERARAEAKAYQEGYYNSAMELSMSEIAEIQSRLEKLGRRYGLIREFRENGII